MISNVIFIEVKSGMEKNQVFADFMPDCRFFCFHNYHVVNAKQQSLAIHVIKCSCYNVVITAV